VLATRSAAAGPKHAFTAAPVAGQAAPALAAASARVNPKEDTCGGQARGHTRHGGGRRAGRSDRRAVLGTPTAEAAAATADAPDAQADAPAALSKSPAAQHTDDAHDEMRAYGPIRGPARTTRNVAFARTRYCRQRGGERFRHFSDGGRNLARPAVDMVL